ncbi:MAG: hypothetical protein RL456_2862 [Pseudomonadota bacterium]|jgi:hypothetical protein
MSTHFDYVISRADYIAELRRDAKFYRSNAEALRKQAARDELAADTLEALANNLDGENGADQP